MSLSDADKALRATGIGSSDISAIVDLDPFRGPSDVWMDKLGLSKKRDEIAFMTGHKLEPVIAEMYCEHTGAVLIDGGGTVTHPEHAWAVATPDRKSNPGPVPIVEIKNVGSWMLRQWAHGLPDEKVIQVQWQLAVCGGDAAHVAALIGGTDFRVFTVERDDELIEWLLEIAERFWVDNVLGRTPPDDNAEARRDAMAALYPKANGLLLPRSCEAEAIRDRLLDVNAREAALWAEKKATEAEALELIGEADGIDGLLMCQEWRGKIDWKKAAMAAGVTEAAAERFRGPSHRVLKAKKDRKK